MADKTARQAFALIRSLPAIALGRRLGLFGRARIAARQTSLLSALFSVWKTASRCPRANATPDRSRGIERREAVGLPDDFALFTTASSRGRGKARSRVSPYSCVFASIRGSGCSVVPGAQ